MNEILEVDPTQTTVWKLNPRKTLGDIAGLVESVRARGVIEPAIARKGPGGKLEIVIGQRRRAATIAAAKKLPVIVRELSEDEALDLALAENIERNDLMPLEEAEAYQLRIERGQTLEHVADRISRTPGYVARRLKLLELGAVAKAALARGDVTVTVAEMIGRIPEKLQKAALEAVGPTRFDRGMSNAEAAKALRERFMLVLKDARFDRADPELVPKAGACSVCPYRTGNQAELFSDVDSPDLCTVPSCFEAKTKAADKIKLAAAKKEGKKILGAAEAKKDVFPYGDDVSSSKYRELDGKVWSGNKHVPVRKLLAGKDYEVVYAVSPKTGALHELVAAGVVNAALRGGKASTAPAKKDKAAAKRDAAAKKKAKLAAEVKDLVARRAVSNAIAALEKGGGRSVEACLRVVVTHLSQFSDYAHSLADRRGLKEKNVTTAIAAVAAKADHTALVGILFELALWELAEGFGPRDTKAFDEALKIFDIDRKVLEKAVLAEREPAKVVVKSTHFHSALGGYLCRVKPSAATGFGGTNSPGAVTCPACKEFLAKGKVPKKPVARKASKTRGKPANGSPARPSQVAEDGDGDGAIDTERTCRGCGCTDEYGCDDGCSWVEADLCSNCAGPQPRGKKAKKGRGKVGF